MFLKFLILNFILVLNVVEANFSQKIERRSAGNIKLRVANQNLDIKHKKNNLSSSWSDWMHVEEVKADEEMKELESNAIDFIKSLVPNGSSLKTLTADKMNHPKV